MTEHELFNTYNKEVYRTCLYMLKNSQDAEDVCHDVFVTVFRQDWSSVKHLRAWIMRIAMNQCLNVIRRNKTKARKQEQLQVLHDQEALFKRSVDSIAIARASFAEMEEMLHKLPDKQISVLTLRYIGDLSVPEIAQILNIPEGTVRSRIHKALKILRRKLEHQNTFGVRGENGFELH